MWLAAENGMFLRFTRGDWMTTMPEHLNMEWVDSVKVLKLILYLCLIVSLSTPSNLTELIHVLQHVFEYFTDRTPRSHSEMRETSLVWNYKYAGSCLLLLTLFFSINQCLVHLSSPLLLFSFSFF